MSQNIIFETNRLDEWFQILPDTNILVFYSEDLQSGQMLVGLEIVNPFQR